MLGRGIVLETLFPPVVDLQSLGDLDCRTAVQYIWVGVLRREAMWIQVFELLLGLLC